MQSIKKEQQDTYEDKWPWDVFEANYGYTLKEILGEGTFGQVMSAIDTATG